jgi:hypothetical protein
MRDLRFSQWYQFDVDYLQFFRIYGNGFRDECYAVRTEGGKEFSVCYQYESH